MSGYDDLAPLSDTWAADMVDDVAFYADLAGEADGFDETSREVVCAPRSPK